MQKKVKWKGEREGFEESLRYLQGRMKKEIKSLKTPWPKWNDAGTDGLEWNSTVVIGGRPGCLSGSSLLYVARKGNNGSGRYYTLRDIYYKFNGLRHNDMHFRDRGWKNKFSKTQSFKEDEKLTGQNEILDVIYSGVKTTFTVTTSSGKQIRTTADHKFLIEDYTYKKLSELKVGDFIMCKSSKISNGRKKRIIRKEITAKMYFYSSAKKRIINKNEYYRIKKSRLVYDAHLNNITVDRFIYEVCHNPNHKLIFSDLKKEIHHIDFDPLNDIPENLKLLTIKEHHDIHNDRSRLGLNFIQKEEIISIELYGEEDTYDICMKDPYNNFIANEFVVHNSGKTLIKDQIVRNTFTLNPGEDIRILEFKLEMVARTSAIREYSSLLGRTYKYLCSAEGTLLHADLLKCHAYAKERIKYPIDVIDEPCTVKEFIQIIIEYMESHSTTETIESLDSQNPNPILKKTYKKTMITLDHTILLKKSEYEKDKMDMLYNLGEALTSLKRKYPVIFIILSQLNRNIDNPERAEDGRYGNYVLESDFFGADAMLQHADMLIGLNRPAKQKIRFYGPDRYIILDEMTLVAHFLKCRNGDTRMSFFKAEFERMQISEMPTPPTQDKKIRTQ